MAARAADRVVRRRAALFGIAPLSHVRFENDAALVSGALAQRGCKWQDNCDVDALADAIVKIGGTSAEEQAAMAQVGKEMVFAEHDKVKQFEKILEIIKEKARGALA